MGLGGVGKSQLAIEYAHRRAAKSTDTWVFWVHAATRARVEEGFRTIADAAKLAGRKQPQADIPQLVYSWLSNERNGGWVMVLDSADDSDVFYKTSEGAPDKKPLAAYLPQSRNGCILVTTRDRDLARRLTGSDMNTMDVGPMEQAEAMLLLEKKIGGLSDKDAAAELVEALDFIPLAISQAAGFIQARRSRSSMRKYLSDFRESERKRARLLGHDGHDLRRDGSASNAVLTTWQMSFEHLRSKRPTAADLLSLMSFFDRQGIPEALLKSVRGDEDGRRAVDATDSDDSKYDSDGEPDDGSEEDGFDDDVATLSDFCLVSTNEEGDVFEMHRLVQLSTRKWLEAHGLQERFKGQFVARMARSFPTGDYSNWTTCQRLFPHVEAAVGYRPAEAKLEEAWATLLHNGGWYARAQGRYDMAERMVDKAKRSREKRVGREDRMTLSSASLLASTYGDQGRWAEAESLGAQVMETTKRVLGPEHHDTLASMANLASTYGDQGRWAEAESLEVQVMETTKRVLGPEHPSTLAIMGNLASTYMDQGRWKEAEKLEIRVMEIRKKVLGEEHPATLASKNNLASTYRNLGRWAEAESLEMQVVETTKRVLGPEHPHTLTSMGNLASTYSNQGRWTEAESLKMQSMETRKRLLGPEHPDTLRSMADLASTYRDQGRWTDAESLGVQVMETRKRLFGPEHPDTLTSMANLASTYGNQGRWTDAELLGLQVMETRKRVLGPEHPATLTCMNNLTLTYMDQERWKEAELILAQVTEIRKKVLERSIPKH